MQAFFYDPKLLGISSDISVDPSVSSVPIDASNQVPQPGEPLAIDDASSAPRESLAVVTLPVPSVEPDPAIDATSGNAPVEENGDGAERKGGDLSELNWEDDAELDALVDMVDMEVESEKKLAVACSCVEVFTAVGTMQSTSEWALQLPVSAGSTVRASEGIRFERI